MSKPSKKENVTRDQFVNQIGKCIVAWQKLEGQLFDLFCLATEIPNQLVASAIFSTVVSFGIKSDITDSSIKSALGTEKIQGGFRYYGKAPGSTHPRKKLLKDWADLYSAIGSNSSLRNRVAHNQLVTLAAPYVGFHGLTLVPQNYKMFHTGDIDKIRKESVTYEKLQKTEKESIRLGEEIEKFKKELEKELSK